MTRFGFNIGKYHRAGTGTDVSAMPEPVREAFGLTAPPAPAIPDAGIASRTLGGGDPIRRAHARGTRRRDIFTTGQEAGQGNG